MNPAAGAPVPTVVLDINVFVSGTTISAGPPGQIINAWREGQFELAISEPMLVKMRQVYLYPQIVKITNMATADIDNFIEDIRQNAVVVPAATAVEISPDPEDNILFATAIEAHAQYLVSGDKKHVLSVGTYQGIRTISPKDFLKQLLTR